MAQGKQAKVLKVALVALESSRLAFKGQVPIALSTNASFGAFKRFNLRFDDPEVESSLHIFQVMDNIQG